MLDLQHCLPENNTLATTHADAHSRQTVRVFAVWEELC